MKTAAISEVKARLSEYLVRVKAGEEVLITDRGRPIARLAPLARAAMAKETLARCERHRCG